MVSHDGAPYARRARRTIGSLCDRYLRCPLRIYVLIVGDVMYLSQKNHCFSKPRNCSSIHENILRSFILQDNCV
jgi:hypothetical protein